MLTNQEAIADLAKVAEAAVGADNEDNNTDEPPESFGIRVFVYGTLKSGHSNHRIIERHLPSREAIWLGRCSIIGPYTMVDLGYFPGVVNHKEDMSTKNLIWGECYRINEEILTHLDILEGNGQFYTRDRVETPWKKAWCYFVPKSYMPTSRKDAIITEGVWRPSDDEISFMALARTK